MNPERHVMSHWTSTRTREGRSHDADAHRRFYDEYNAVLDMPAEYHLRTIRVVFQEHLLPRGLWDVAGERADPGAIRETALMTIEGELDDIAGVGRPAPRTGCARHPRGEPVHLHGAGRGPLRHLQRPALAQRGSFAGARFHHRGACGDCGRRGRTGRPAKKSALKHLSCGIGGPLRPPAVIRP